MEVKSPPEKDTFQVTNLLKIQKIEQRTPEWYVTRDTMITASDWATAIGEGHFNNKNDFIIKKCGKGVAFTGNIYTEWGVKYEPVATKLYELRNKVKIYEFGVLRHPTYSFLGASPDGITLKGIMLEIKCPYSRKITGIVPRDYWIQVQGQLEVCDLTFCDFLECKIIEYSIEEYLEDTNTEKGAVLTYTVDGTNKYFYSDFNISKKEIDDWCIEIRKKIPSDWKERRITFWKFDKIRCVSKEILNGLNQFFQNYKKLGIW